MNAYWIAVALPLLVQLVLFVRWLHRRTREDEMQRLFVRDLALNHLPHIYHALKQIARKMRIEMEEPPPTRYVSFDRNGK